MCVKVTGEKRVLNSELWHACAGPLVSLPPLGSRVVYFPQGHSEQVCLLPLCYFEFFLLQISRLLKNLWTFLCTFRSLLQPIKKWMPIHQTIRACNHSLSVSFTMSQCMWEIFFYENSVFILLCDSGLFFS